MKRLIYLTNTFPFGNIADWNIVETRILQRYFDEIVLAPLIDLGITKHSHLPPTVRTLPPLFTAKDLVFSKWDLRLLFSIRLPIYLGALLSQIGHGPIIARKWVLAALKVERICRNQVFQQNVLPELNNAVLYFYWGLGYAEILPFLPRALQVKSVVRLHGHDLYDERNDGWIPFQGLIAKTAFLMVPVSGHGARYLTKRFPRRKDSIAVHRLGAKAQGSATVSTDGILRVVSCAYVNPVKRLNLIVDTLSQTQIPVDWMHIGGGQQLDELKRYAGKLPQHIRTVFLDNVPPDEVGQIYARGTFDVFLSVSSSEGIPVSIMEAMGAGIPVIATAVGGTAEIVDDDVGGLLPENFEPSMLARKLEQLASLPFSARKLLIQRCLERQLAMYDGNRNAELLGETLLALTGPGELG